MTIPVLKGGLTFETLATALNFSSLSYAVSALTRRHRVDYAGNRAHGLCDSQGFTQNFMGHLRMAFNKDAHKNYWHNTQDISGTQQSEIDPKDIPLPVYTAFSTKDIWSYDADPTLLKDYHIHKLWGLVGQPGKRNAALLGLVSIPKTPENNDTYVKSDKIFISFKGTQGGVGATSLLFGLWGKATPEWNTDMDNTQVSFFNSPGKVHQGFSHAVLSFMANLEKILEDNQGTYIFRDRPIVVTGHSLGGALATLTAYCLTKYLGFTNVTLITIAEPLIGNKAFVNDIEATLKDRINSFYIKGDLVKKTLSLREYVPLPSSQELSAASSLHNSFARIDAHYYESIRFLLYYWFGNLVDYQPLVQQYTHEMTMFNRETNLTMRSRNGRITEVTGLTYIKPEELQRLLRPENINFKASEIFDKYNKKILQINTSYMLLTHYYQKELANKLLHVAPIKKFLVLFYFMTKDQPRLAKENKELYTELTALIQWLKEEKVPVHPATRHSTHPLLISMMDEIKDEIIGNMMNELANQNHFDALRAINDFLQAIKEDRTVTTFKITAQYIQDKLTELETSFSRSRETHTFAALINSLKQFLEIVHRNVLNAPYQAFQELSEKKEPLPKPVLIMQSPFELQPTQSWHGPSNLSH